MGISTDRRLRQQLIFFSMLLMILGLFLSRVVLSSGLIACTAFCCVHKKFLQQLTYLFSNPLLLGVSLLLLIPVFTWFWSEDKLEWWRWIRVKLPLFILPVIFAGEWQLSSRQWRQLCRFFLLLVFAGCCWSIWQYLQNMHAVHLEYFRAKLIATPLENDHVRFSVLVCFAVIFCVKLFIRNPGSAEKIFLFLATVFFIFYLHLLSARTGLIGFYLFLMASIVYLLLRLRKTKWMILLLSMLVLLPVASWFFLPTFQNRIRYVWYDLSLIRKNVYLPGANDGNRILSLRAGWTILQQHAGGVGSGDVMQKTMEWYRLNAPGVQASEQIYPSSEWLLYGDSAGWIGMVLFTLIMMLPFFEKNRKEKFFWFVLNFISAFSLLFDVGLETQFGVFIYAFLLLSLWKSGRKRIADSG
ncbi:MAG: hypothetical protein ACJ75B_16695 [Flavisolibacter sp.]